MVIIIPEKQEYKEILKNDVKVLLYEGRTLEIYPMWTQDSMVWSSILTILTDLDSQLRYFVGKNPESGASTLACWKYIYEIVKKTLKSGTLNSIMDRIFSTDGANNFDVWPIFGKILKKLWDFAAMKMPQEKLVPQMP